MSVLGENIIRMIYSEYNEKDYQPDSLDLRLGGMYDIDECDNIGIVDNVKVLPTFTVIEPNADGVYLIEPHKSVIVNVSPSISIPKDAMQLYFLRSSLMRMGISLQTCVGDSGFHGVLYFMLTNNSPNTIRIKRNERFATAVTFRVEGSTLYDGDYNED